MKSSRLDQRSGGWVLLLPPSTLYVTKPNHPIIFLPNPPQPVLDIINPISGLFTPRGPEYMGKVPSTIQEKGQRSSFIAHCHVVLSSGFGGTRNRGSNVAISTALLPFLAHQSWSHEYGNNGESFYQRRPLKLLVVFTQISTTIAAHLIQSHTGFEMDFWIKSDYFSAAKEFFNDPSCLWRRALWWQVSPPC